MARITHVKSARQRYEMVPVIDPDTGLPKTTPVTRRDGSPKLTKHGKPIVIHPTVADTSKPLPMPRCEACSTTIEVGQPYKWVAPRSGPFGGRKRYRCGTCPPWRPSELSSSKMATVIAAQEEFDDALPGAETVEDLEALRDALVEAIRGVADEYQESVDSMVEGFGHETATSDELAEKVDALNGWADDLEALDFEDFEGCEACDGTGQVDGADCEDCDGTGEDEAAADEHWEEQRQLLADEAGSCPV